MVENLAHQGHHHRADQGHHMADQGHHHMVENMGMGASAIEEEAANDIDGAATGVDGPLAHRGHQMMVENMAHQGHHHMMGNMGTGASAIEAEAATGIDGSLAHQGHGMIVENMVHQGHRYMVENTVGSVGSGEPMVLEGGAESAIRGDTVAFTGSGEPMVLGRGAERASKGVPMPSATNPHNKSWASIVDGGRVATEMSLPLDVADLKFTSVGKGMFLLRTSSEADLKFILSPGRWYVGGRLLIANQWHPELIGGSFVEADEYTKHLHRFGFARIKIEIPLGFSPTLEIEMEISGGKIFVQTIEYETKVKYCTKCGSTAHFDGSCAVRVATTEGEKVAPNGWQLVKTPRRRAPLNKDKDDHLKQNRFQALTSLPETKTDGESSAKCLGGRVMNNTEAKGKASTNLEASNRAEEGPTPVALPKKQGAESVQAPQAVLESSGTTPSTPKDIVFFATTGSNIPLESKNTCMSQKVKKQTLKHREVNGTKKRTSSPKEIDRKAKMGECIQENTDPTMVEVTPVREDGLSSDDMDVGNVVAKASTEAMEDDNEDDTSKDLMGTTHGSGRLPQTLVPGPTVTPEENDELLKPITDTEIKWAVMEADRDSAPGPDGFGNSFFQANWSVVHEEAIDVTEEQCRHLVLRSSQKLTLWKQKCLSFAGRLSLIKHVLSMVPAYWSLVVKIPATTCKLLNKMAVEFLWGDSTDHKNHHRIKWATLCLPKLEGGVGLRDLSETNQANLAYLVYRMSQQSSPWAELVRGRYYERKGLTDNSIRGKRVSKAWRRALQA
ncbi:putative ribonuclease H protein [Nymphaea thermarum]|nr:putative ribonuclease H protein [Nymphaea thermarum]